MTRTFMRHDAEIGTLYTPNLKLRVAGESGGYLVRTNAAGFRSEREFVPQRAPGTFRAVMFGDSQTAGDGVSNTQRFSDRLEQEVAGLEVYNYGIGGTGPDQHFLTYQRHSHMEHDLLVLVVYAENIRRVSRRVIESRDAAGAPVYYAKPYFERVNGKLELRNVPVSKQIWSEHTLPDEYRPFVYSHGETNVFSHLTGKSGLPPRLPKALAPVREFARSAALRFSGFRPLPEYDAPDDPDWLLLRAILENWIHSSSKPVLLVPIPHYVTFVSSRDPTCHRERFRELADATGCQLYDVVPDLLKVPTDERRLLWSDWSGHLSAAAHKLLAELLAPVMEALMRHPQAAVNVNGTAGPNALSA